MAESSRFNKCEGWDLTYQLLLDKWKGYGLELTMLEAVRLKLILESCRKNNSEVEDFGQSGC